MKQAELGAAAEMKQGRISVLERIGEVSFSIETLIKLASAFRVGLTVKFVPMSEMLAWENSFLPDEFDVAPLEKDEAFLHPEHSESSRRMSPGLCYAMLGEQGGFVDVISVHPVQSASSSSSWQTSIPSPSSSATEAADNLTSQMPMDSASMCATLNQNTHERGYAA
jgi:transcriptional regulator with XRE-family HTH domain